MGNAIGMGVLASRTGFKIYEKLLSKYLGMEDIVKDIVKSSELGAEPGVESLWAEGLFSLFISWSIREKAQDIEVIKGVAEGAMKNIIEV